MLKMVAGGGGAHNFLEKMSREPGLEGSGGCAGAERRLGWEQRAEARRQRVGGGAFGD